MDNKQYYLNVKKSINKNNGNFAILKLAVNGDENLKKMYYKSILKHNCKMLSDVFVDSGVDLFVPDNVNFSENFKVEMIDFKVKTEMIYCNLYNDEVYPTAFVIHPRSSISKTPLMLANNTGIIDSGYRGSLLGAFRSFSKEDYLVEQNTRLIQICHSTLCPIYVYLVNEHELCNSERGAGGFGSTGI